MPGITSRQVNDWSRREVPRVARDLAKSRSGRRVAEYILAVAASGLALVGAAVLDPVTEHASFPLVLGAVTVSAWFGGLGPGVVAAVIGAVAINYFFEVPANSIEIGSLNSGIDLVVFIVIALVISSLSGNLLNARHYAQVQQSRAEAARARAELLAESGELLAQALGDPRQVLRQLADLLVQHLAWYCTIDLLECGVLRRALIASSDPQEQELIDTLGAYSPKPASPHPAWEALRTGRPVIVPRVADELLVAVAHEPSHLAAMRRTRPGSVVVVPLRARAGLLDVITLMWPQGGAHTAAEIVDLAQAVADRAAVMLEQARLQADLRDAVASRDALLACVAHDLRNPLGMIRLGAETAQVSMPQLGPAQHERRAETIATLTEIERLSHRMDGYIQELLDAAALQQTGELTLHRTPTDLVWLVRTALDSMAMQDHRLRLEMSAPTLPVEVDDLRLLRVLDNLIANALKSTARPTRPSW